MVREACLASIVVALWACGEDGDGRVAGSAPIDRVECPDNAGCDDAVDLDGVTYFVTCAALSPEQLGEVVGGSGSDSRFDQARTIRNEAPDRVVALHAPRGLGGCESREWIAGYSPSEARTLEDALENGRLACEVPAEPDDERCMEGGPFVFVRDPSAPGPSPETNQWEAVWLGDAVRRINAELASGGGPRHRLDPLDVVAEELSGYERDSLYPPEALFRLGVRTIESAPGRVVMEVIRQNGLKSDSGVDYRTQQENYTVEQIGGGPAWFTTGFVVTDSTYGRLADAGDRGEAGHRQADAIWAPCCDRVIADLTR